jgi:hypothetical protein
MAQERCIVSLEGESKLNGKAIEIVTKIKY